MCDVIALTVKERLKDRGDIEREREREGEGTGRLLPGAAQALGLRGEVPPGCALVCAPSGAPEASPRLPVP